jgi:hypothetical protein
MQESIASLPGRRFLCAAALATILLVFMAPSSIAGCGAAAEEVDASCYNGNLQAAVADALASDRPLLLPSGTYPISQTLVIDYTSRADSGFRILSQGARIDATAINNGPALAVICSGGSTAKPKGCFYFHEEGTLFINADTPDYAVRFGLDDFSDAHNSAKIDHLIVNNRNQTPAASGVRLNFVLNSDFYLVSDAGGGGAGLDLGQVQFSRLSGAASATNGIAMLIRGGYTMANTIQAMDLEVARVCLMIDSPTANHNTFISPYFACPTALVALSGASNLLLNALYAGTPAARPGSLVGIVALP